MAERRQEFRSVAVLKSDLLGRVEHGYLPMQDGSEQEVARRDLAAAAWCLRPLARHLARREARGLEVLAGVAGVPRLVARTRHQLDRTWIGGRPLQEGGPPSEAWFEEARALLDALHARGVTHNDLHKEPNLLVTADGHPALVDFQLASVFHRRGRWFRLYVDEDLRHLLKHKRRYYPASLTDDDRARLAKSSWIARTWAALVKGPYNLVTRRLLRWRDNEGRS